MLYKRYFQITKNCFKYYKNIFEFKNKENPLLQFDIRRISHLNVINTNNNIILNDNNVFLNNNNLKFIFQIYLNNIKCIFLFGDEIEENEKNICNILNYTQKYYQKYK